MAPRVPNPIPLALHALDKEEWEVSEVPFDWETCSSRNYSSSSSPALLLAAAAAADITRASRPATAAPQTAALGAKQIFHVIHQIGLGSTFCKGSRTFFCEKFYQMWVGVIPKQGTNP